MAAFRASGFGVIKRRTLGAFLLAVVLSHCAHRPPAPDSTISRKESPLEWYVAQRDPLTYCPQGHKLPPPRAAYGPAPTYVYLADRSTRFYIPPGAARHHEQALELRRLSESGTRGLRASPPTLHDTTRWVRRALARTAVTGVVVAAAMFGGAPQESSIADDMMETVWEDDD